MNADGLTFPIIFSLPWESWNWFSFPKGNFIKLLREIYNQENNSQSKTLNKVQLSWKVIKGALFNTGSSYSYLLTLMHLCSSRQISFNFYDIYVILCTYLNPEIQKWEEMWCLSVLWRQTYFTYYDDFWLHPYPENDIIYSLWQKRFYHVYVPHFLSLALVVRRPGCLHNTVVMTRVTASIDLQCFSRLR